MSHKVVSDCCEESTNDSIEANKCVTSVDDKEEFYGLCQEMSDDSVKASYLLIEQYCTTQSETERVKKFINIFPYFLQIPRDGNCFYRAFVFGFIVFRNQHDLIIGIKEKAIKAQEILLQHGYSTYTIVDFFETADTFFTQLLDTSLSDSDIFKTLLQPTTSNYYTAFFKLMISSQLLKSSEYYINFITDYDSMQAFCNREIEPLGRHCGELETSVLAEVLGIKFRVYSITLKCNEIQDYPNNDQEPQINLIYSPGHYELLLHQKIN